jgi:hypothetical protein
MSTELVGARAQAKTRRSRRALAVSALGPLTALAGLAWAIAQPYRITMLEPAGKGFWTLVVQPPLLVIVAAAIFHFLVLPGLLADLESEAEG